MQSISFATSISAILVFSVVQLASTTLYDGYTIQYMCNLITLASHSNEAIGEGHPATGPENEPGRLIYVYRNGDKFKNYKRYVVNRKTVRSLDYLFTELTKLLEPSFGAVRNLRTPTHGRVVQSLEEIEGGKSYVAAGHGRFVRLPYAKARSLTDFTVPGKIKHSADPYGAPKPVVIKPVKHSRILASGKVKKDPGDSFFLHIYVNGDEVTPAIKVRLMAAERSTMVSALNAINKKVHTMTGAVLRLYSLAGEKIRIIDELQNGGSYVAVGREKQFKVVAYGKHSLPVWHAGKHVNPLTPTSLSEKDLSNGNSLSTANTHELQSKTNRSNDGGPAGSRLSNPYQKPLGPVPKTSDHVVHVEEKEQTSRRQSPVRRDINTEQIPPADKDKLRKPSESTNESQNQAKPKKEKKGDEFVKLSSEAVHKPADSDLLTPRREPSIVIDKPTEDKKKPDDVKTKSDVKPSPRSEGKKQQEDASGHGEHTEDHKLVRKESVVAHDLKKENVPSRSGTQVMTEGNIHQEASKAHHDQSVHLQGDSSSRSHHETNAQHSPDGDKPKDDD